MRAAVRRVWVLENLTKIGTGGFYHLAYPHNQITQELLKDMRHRFDHGRIQVFLLSDDSTAYHVADGEIIAIHWFQSFVRIHFMIRDVRSIGDATATSWDTAYMLVK